MITKGKFENRDGSYIFLHDANWPFSDYTTEVDVRMDEQDRAGAWGIHETYTYLGKRIHHFEGDLLADDSADYWHRRLDFIQALTPHTNSRIAGKLRLDLVGLPEEVWCNCTLDGWPELPLESLSPSAGRFMVSFKSFDPRLYGSYVNEITLDNILTDSGRVYPRLYPNIGGILVNIGGVWQIIATHGWQYSSIYTSPESVYNAGNAPTLPTVIIYGPATNPRIQLSTGSGIDPYIKVNVELVDSSDFVTIDFSETTAFDRYGNDIYSKVDQFTEWWELPPGSSDVVYLADEASSPSKAVVQWYNAYMI